MSKLFDFLNDEYYNLMIRMAKESFCEKDSLECCKDFNKLDNRKLYDICLEHELEGVVGARALSLGLELSEEWKSRIREERERLLFLREKTSKICEKLSDLGIRMVILKNGGIMADIIEDPVCCPMEDIDSFVKKSDFLKAHELLEKEGFVFKFRSEYEKEELENAYRDGSTEYYYTMPTGNKMWFELSWRAVAGRWIRPDLEPQSNELIARSYSAKFSNAFILSPEDNLLQICIHTAKHSYVRAPGLRLHMDVDRIVSNVDIDWDEFLKKVCLTHVKTASYFSLYIPKKLFGTNVPDYVLESLKPRNSNKIEKLIAKAGLVHPHESKFGKIQFLIFQTLLYDNIGDVLRVIYPGKGWIIERYNCKTTREVVTCVIFRFFDLVGIRKKK